VGTNSELETEPQHHQLPQQERDVDASLAWVSRMVGLTTVITDTIDIIPQTVNNESEETEWPKVDVRNLIIDLDADIKADSMMASREKTDPAPMSRPHPVGGAPGRPSPTSGPMSRPVSHTGSLNNGQTKSNPAMPGTNFVKQQSYGGGHQEPSGLDSEKGLKMKIKRTKSGRQEIVKTEGGQVHNNTNGDSENSPLTPPSPQRTSKVTESPSSAVKHGDMNGQDSKVNVMNTSNGNNQASLQNSNRLKVDAGTWTDASTLTEPENLGPCEPGTSVNLEGIVWHETDTGVLVVNITWRGKTYVGTLLDCTRHTNQWSAPRFTDSPEPGSKGRAKRNRTSMTPADMEPRKNLRSSKAKGKGKNGKNAAVAANDEFNFPAPSSPAKDSGKRKGRPDDVDESKKRKRTGSESDPDNSGDAAENDDTGDDTPPVSSVTKREPKPVVYSYKMLECPRRDCNKQYKHDEGLRWHLSHSHPEFIDSNGDIKDAATVEREEQERRRKARLLKEERKRENKNDSSDGKSENKGLPPSKVAKLDDKSSRDALNCSSPKLTSSKGVPTATVTTTVASSPRPGVPVAPVVSGPRPATNGGPPLAGAAMPGALPGVKPPVGASPLPSSVASNRLPGQLPPGLIAPSVKPSAQVKPTELTPLLDDLKKQQQMVTEPARIPGLDSDKPPVNSPAYSDISDDGEDSRGKDIKMPTAVPVSHVKSSSSISSLTSFSAGLPVPDPGVAVDPPGVRSSSVPPPHDSSSVHPHRVSTPSSHPLHSPRDRPVFSSPSVGPSPGTPEYHKYLAANGFPPFPYPYPVGMDPNYHVQLLKTDPIYKAKWEKDRAERERAFKEELDKDQGRYSGLSLLKDDNNKTSNSLPSTPIRRPDSSHKLPEDLRKREPSGDRKTAPSPIISVKPEFREREDVKKEVKMEEGVKPTMETRGPPPGPQTFGYMHPSLVRPPYSSLAGLPPPFDPILTPSLAPFGLAGGPNPYLSSIRPPTGAFPFPGDPLRSSFPSLPSPEDLARAGLPGVPGGPPGLSGTKALDLLQQHANQYYANQKLAELQERALKSPSQSMGSSSASLPGGSPSVSKSITTIAGKDSPSPVSTTASDKSKSPPPLRHVHTHTHTHIGLGYPLLPPVPGALPPVPGGLPPGALPPPVGVVPASFTGSYPGKSA